MQTYANAGQSRPRERTPRGGTRWHPSSVEHLPTRESASAWTEPVRRRQRPGRDGNCGRGTGTALARPRPREPNGFYSANASLAPRFDFLCGRKHCYQGRQSLNQQPELRALRDRRPQIGRARHSSPELSGAPCPTPVSTQAPGAHVGSCSSIAGRSAALGRSPCQVAADLTPPRPGHRLCRRCALLGG